MSKVFISYRQTNEAERQRVREFGERLRRCRIDVVLDQFYMDDHPGGPGETWAKWSSDRALETDFVLIVGTPEWFACFDKKQPPGEGLGAACEADDLRQRIYDANGIVENIRVVLFENAAAAHVSGKLKGYHRFRAERDFEFIVRWLGGVMPVTTASTPTTSIKHNLPSLQPFFGRDDELRRIAEALEPESRTWGALINGPGGMGKTSLAVRAAYEASADAFDRIVFVSLKSRELDDEGVRDLSGFLISGLAELFNEIAREIGKADIAKATDDQRPRLLLDGLRDARTLLVLDNLESLLKRERDTLYTFVKRLPQGSKAILTSRGRRIGSGAEELILARLDEDAALATLEKLAETNPTLRQTNEAERLTLYRETGGTPLLLRWTAGQIGRGSCLTFTDALFYLRSCPAGNDPLEFVFGDLVEDFSKAESQVLSALTYFTLPAKTEHIIELAQCPPSDVEPALRSLVNRSLVVPSNELKTFALVPLVADFLRKKNPETIAETGTRLEDHAFAMVVENGFKKYDRFHILEASWPTIAAALPRLIAGANDRLQELCTGLDDFLNFTGRWDEQLALARDAELRAIHDGDYFNAGRRAYDAGWVHNLRAQASEVLAFADRAEAHWVASNAGARWRAVSAHLRGSGFTLTKDYTSAIAAFKMAAEIDRGLDAEGKDLAIDLNALAGAEQQSGDVESAMRHYDEAVRIARATDYKEGLSSYIGNLAGLAIRRGDWATAETLATEAWQYAKAIGRLELIAASRERLAKALLGQGRFAAALPHAIDAVEIYLRIGSHRVQQARRTLEMCHARLATG